MGLISNRNGYRLPKRKRGGGGEKGTKKPLCGCGFQTMMRSICERKEGREVGERILAERVLLRGKGGEEKGKKKLLNCTGRDKDIKARVDSLE